MEAQLKAKSEVMWSQATADLHKSKANVVAVQALNETLKLELTNHRE
jgi:hypothetical protein